MCSPRVPATMGLLTQWRGVAGYMLDDPATFFDRYDADHGLGYPLRFLLVTWLASMVPLWAVVAIGNVSTPAAVAKFGLGLAVVGVFFWASTAVEAAIAHGLLALVVDRGLATTLEAYAFPSVVRYGLWWLPIANLGLGLYGLSLQVRGLASFHDVPTGVAGIAAVVAAVLSVPASLVGLYFVAVTVVDVGSAI